MLWFLGSSLSAEHAGSTLQQKGTVAVQSAFIGKSAYSRKNTSADSSACASLTCESRAYSVIPQQKGSAQQGMAVYLTAFHIHSAPPAKALSLFILSRLSVGSEASLCSRSIFESTTCGCYLEFLTFPELYFIKNASWILYLWQLQKYKVKYTSWSDVSFIVHK